MILILILILDHWYYNSSSDKGPELIIIIDVGPIQENNRLITESTITEELIKSGIILLRIMVNVKRLEEGNRRTIELVIARSDGMEEEKSL